MTIPGKVDPYIVGPPIERARDFYGRCAQLEQFFQKLDRAEPGSIRVRGMRRSGKTSFLRYVARGNSKQLQNLQPQPAIAYVDLLAGVREPADFYGAVAEALHVVAPSAARPADRYPDFHSIKSFLEKVGRVRRPVILLDELEKLTDHAKFDSDFWGGLRSLTQVTYKQGTHFEHGGVVWVTASYRDVGELTNRPGEITSQFYNVFDPAPIILGSLNDSEATELIVRPAARCGMPLVSEEVRMIRKIAGGIPYFLQGVAAIWLVARRAGIPAEQCYEKVLAELFVPTRSSILVVARSNWNRLNLTEQLCLECAALQKAMPEREGIKEMLDSLADFGLLFRHDGDWRPAGEMLRRWILSTKSKRGHTGVFIGHGGRQLWRTVRDFLEDKLHFQAICYDAEPREGKSIVPLLEDMLDHAESAVIVLTAEDKMADRANRARQNVIHEAGYCQGRLGFEKVVLLKQKGVENPSNLDGLQYIEFEGDRIQDTFPALHSFFLQ